MKKPSDLRIPFTWDNRRPIRLDRAMYIPNYYDRHHEWGVLNWSNEDMFGNHNPIAIEFCCGNGQWIGEQAKARPEYNWVGVDKLFARARKVWAKIHREEISNLWVVCAEAHTFALHYVPSESVQLAYINFPDPWPKLRHAKNRLVRREFLEQLARILQPDGELFITTDDLPYLEWMIQEFSSPWQSIYPSPGYATNLPDFGRSFFNDLWIKQGRTIYHLWMKKNL